jgi:hypothetical protein
MVSELNMVLDCLVFAVLGLRECRRCGCSYRIVLVHYACKEAYGLPKVWPPLFHPQYSPAHCTCRTDTIVNILMMYTINTGLITGSVEISCRLPVRLRDPQHLYRTVFRSGDVFFTYRVYLSYWRHIAYVQSTQLCLTAIFFLRFILAWTNVSFLGRLCK